MRRLPQPSIWLYVYRRSYVRFLSHWVTIEKNCGILTRCMNMSFAVGHGGASSLFQCTVVYLRYSLGICLEGLRKSFKSTSRIVGVPAEIRTELCRIQVHSVTSRPFCFRVSPRRACPECAAPLNSNGWTSHTFRNNDMRILYGSVFYVCNSVAF
jgi:hypothetical protein